MKKLSVLLLSAALTAGCTDLTRQEQHDAAFGMSFMAITAASIAAGTVAGLAFLPYLIMEDIHYSDHAMQAGNVNATLDDTYRYAYNRPLETVPASGDTGRIFTDMKGATAHFQKVLRGHGVANAENYVLTAVRTADREGYTLYALVNRPSGDIRVRDARGRVRTLSSRDDDYYKAYRQDASGRALDMVVDWAGVPRTSIRTQKGQAILMTLAANSVLINRRSDDYWWIEQRWIRGDHRGVVAERQKEIDRRLG